jgi:para-aminobenzoate synthetase component 1
VAGSGDLCSVEVVDLPHHHDGTVHLDALLEACAPADLLESGDGSGWSYVVPHGPARLIDDGVTTRWTDPDGRTSDEGRDPFAAIERWCDRLGIVPDAPPPAADDPAFTGGFVGALAYDLGHRVEHLPRQLADDRAAPHLWLHLAEVVVAVCPARERVVVLGRDLLGRGDVTARMDDLLARIGRAGQPAAAPAGPRPPARPPVLRSSLDHASHLAGVEAVLEHIAAGDVFQVNLTQRLSTTWAHDAAALYRALRRESPAAFGALLPAIGVASVSPETFLAVSGHQVTTRPIKGTRPRHPDPDLDAALADDLSTSVKDRAENVMVVDLERNDLGRVCLPGSVRVPELVAVEAHPTVWHLVSTVTGELRPDVGYGELLRATFPCGSITGAPKIAAMRIIERVETVRRGWYCGAVGFLSPGAASLSVAIRTATLQPDGTVDYGAGGGIVADSDPADERRESFDKATAFLRAVGLDPEQVT